MFHCIASLHIFVSSVAMVFYETSTNIADIEASQICPHKCEFCMLWIFLPGIYKILHYPPPIFLLLLFTYVSVYMDLSTIYAGLVFSFLLCFDEAQLNMISHKERRGQRQNQALDQQKTDHMLHTGTMQSILYCGLWNLVKAGSHMEVHHI